jgi:hypothetical protein
MEENKQVRVKSHLFFKVGTTVRKEESTKQILSYKCGDEVKDRTTVQGNNVINYLLFYKTVIRQQLKSN